MTKAKIKKVISALFLLFMFIVNFKIDELLNPILNEMLMIVEQ